MNEMRRTAVTLVLGALVCAFFAASAAADEAQAAQSKQTIQQLIKELGADSYLARQRAQKELIKIGPPAVEPLEKALESGDAEVALRAKKALAEIRKRAAERASRQIRKNLLWTLRLPAGAAGSPVVAGGRALVLDSGGRLCAADVRTGKKLWDVAVRLEGGFLAAKATVYAFDRDGELRSLNAETGQVDPKFRCMVIAGTPALADGVIYVPIVHGRILALDAETGRMKWKSDILTVRIGFGPPPVVAEKAIYAATPDGAIVALDRRTGRKLWSAACGAKTGVGALALDAGRVIVRSDGGIRAFDRDTGKPAWQRALAGPGRAIRLRRQVLINGRALVLDSRQGCALGVTCSQGVAYLADGERLVGLDVQTGREKWTYKVELKGKPDSQGAGRVIQLGGRGQRQVFLQGVIGDMVLGLSSQSGATAPVVADGVMYFGSRGGLHAVDLKTRQELWRFTAAGPVVGRPAIAEGVIYFGTAAGAKLRGRNVAAVEGRLHALRLKAKN